VTKMKRRGVPAALLEELDDLLERDGDLADSRLATEVERAALAAAALRKRYAGRPEEERRRKLSQALLRRGFSWDTIRELVGEEPTEEST
jgi:SOS response regulatory protein OraA/RecX